MPGEEGNSHDEMSDSDHDVFDLSSLSAASKGVSPNHAPVLVNEVLAFTWSYMHTSNMDATCQQLVRSFKESDIIRAKTTLWQFCSAHQSVIGNCKKRRDSTGRSGAMAHAVDIVQALHKLDSQKKVPTIVVDARELPSMPSCTVKSGELEERMSRLEDICHQMQQTLMKLCQRSPPCDLIDERLSSLEATTNRLQGTAAQMAQHVYQEEFPNLLASHDSDAPFQPDSMTTIPKVTVSSQNQPNGQGRVTMAHMASALSSTEKPFQETKVKKPPPPKKKRDKQGSGGACNGLLAGRDTFQVQLTNLHSSTTCSELKEFVQKKIKDKESFKVTDTSSEGWETKRFLLTFAQKDYDTVVDEAFWPSRIYFRRYFPARGRPKPRDSPGTNGS